MFELDSIEWLLGKKIRCLLEKMGGSNVWCFGDRMLMSWCALFAMGGFFGCELSRLGIWMYILRGKIVTVDFL